MTQAVSGIESGVQPSWWLTGVANDDDNAFANLIDETGGTDSADPSSATGSATDAANPLQQLVSDLQNLILAFQEVETGDIAPSGAGDDATTVSTGVTGDSNGAVTGNDTFTAQVTGSDAGYDSSYGYYITDAQGNPVSGQILFTNVKDGGSVTIPGVDPSHVGFFIIPNGANDNSGLTNGEPITFQKVSGQWTAVDSSGQAVSGSGANVLFDKAALNGDRISHVQDNNAPGDQNWEDLYGGGDNDFNDVDVNVTWGGAASAALGDDSITMAGAWSSTTTVSNGTVSSQKETVAIAKSGDTTAIETAWESVMTAASSASGLISLVNGDATTANSFLASQTTGTNATLLSL